MLELDNGGGSLTGHVVDSVLVTEPVGALDGVVHVPSPVVLVHVTQSSVDTALSSDGVGTSREELGDTGSIETSLGKTKGSTETGTTGTDNKSIVLVVLFRCQFSIPAQGIRSFGFGFTHDDGVLVANERRSLLGAQGPVGNDASCRIESSVCCFRDCRGGCWDSYSPAGRVVEKALACAGEN